MKSSGLRDLIERRERLFAYDRDPQGTLDWLRHELGLHFSHQREKVPGQKPDLPTHLDPQSITRAAFIRRATAQQDNLTGFQDSALDWILRDGGVELTSGRRRALLSRLDRPDYDKLVDLILADFRTKESRGFGEFNIHRALLLDQMDALLERKPDLRTNTNFVHTYLTKLAPGRRRRPARPDRCAATTWSGCGRSSKISRRRTIRSRHTSSTRCSITSARPAATTAPSF